MYCYRILVPAFTILLTSRFGNSFVVLPNKHLNLAFESNIASRRLMNQYQWHPQRDSAKLISVKSLHPSTHVAMTMDLSEGAATVASSITSALQSGPLGIAAMTAVASTVLIPLTVYRQAYSFSVAYGASVAAMGLALLYAFPNASQTGSLLALSAVFYGLRLAGFLLLREFTVPEKAKQIKEFDTSSRINRIPFAVLVAIFYAFMASPALYSLRQEPSLPWLANIGVGMAWIGAFLETAGDAQKFIAKRDESFGPDDFAGPTGGVYALVRHPNYLGEIVFWTGLLLGGVPSFGTTSPVPWVCGGLGYFGILNIMTSAAKKLEEKQSKKYEGQKTYEEWTSRVRWPLFPLVE